MDLRLRRHLAFLVFTTSLLLSSAHFASSNSDFRSGELTSEGEACAKIESSFATGGGQKLLNAVPNSVLNTANHIFGPKSLAKHNLEQVLKSFGGDAVAATYRLQNAAQNLANQGTIKGIFDTTINIAGQNVTIRGAVIDGVAHLRTAFIP